MGKQLKGWKDAPIVEEDNGTDSLDNKPKWASAPIVEESVKKKDLTVSAPEPKNISNQPGLEESGVQSKQESEPISKNTDMETREAMSEKILGTIFKGIGAAAKQIYSGLTDIAPKSAAQAKEVLLSNLQSASPEEFVKNKKSIEFQKYVREKEGMKWYEPFDIEKAIKHAPEFVKEKYPDIQKSIEKNRPETIQRRLELEKYVQKQNKESAEKLKGVPQSYKEIQSPEDAVKYAFNMGAQGLWQIPLTIITKGASGAMMEAAEVYDQQLDQLASEHNISREEVIKKGLDKPAEGQLHALAAAGLDLVSAGGLMDIVKKGGAPLLKKTIAAANEVITEPTQGMLEEMGGAKATKTSQKEAFKKAWSTNLSRRIDEAAGGLFGSTAVNIVTKSPQQTIEDAKSKITSTDDQSTIKDEADKIVESVSKPTPSGGVKNAIQKQSSGSILQHSQERVGETGGERGRMEPSEQGEEITGTRKPENEGTPVSEQPKEETLNQPINENDTGIRRTVSETGIQTEPQEGGNKPESLGGLYREGEIRGEKNGEVRSSGEEASQQIKEGDKIFVYGTLQNPETQKKVFGEKIQSQPAEAKGTITEGEGFKDFHPEGKDIVRGEVLTVTPEQLNKVTNWEQDYTRKKITLANGEEAWVFEEKPKQEQKHEVSTVTKAIQEASRLFDEINSTEGASKKRRLAEQRRLILESNPSVKYLDDNIPSIYEQLEAKNIIKRKGKCP